MSAEREAAEVLDAVVANLRSAVTHGQRTYNIEGWFAPAERLDAALAAAAGGREAEVTDPADRTHCDRCGEFWWHCDDNCAGDEASAAPTRVAGHHLNCAMPLGYSCTCQANDGLDAEAAAEGLL